MEKSVNRLSETEKNELFHVAQLEGHEAVFRKELISFGDIRHFFAHLGEAASPETKLQQFQSDTLRKALKELELSEVPEIQVQLQKINFNSDTCFFQ